MSGNRIEAVNAYGTGTANGTAKEEKTHTHTIRPFPTFRAKCPFRADASLQSAKSVSRETEVFLQRRPKARPVRRFFPRESVLKVLVRVASWERFVKKKKHRETFSRSEERPRNGAELDTVWGKKPSQFGVNTGDRRGRRALRVSPAASTCLNFFLLLVFFGQKNTTIPPQTLALEYRAPEYRRVFARRQSVLKRKAIPSVLNKTKSARVCIPARVLSVPCRGFRRVLRFASRKKELRLRHFGSSR